MKQSMFSKDFLRIGPGDIAEALNADGVIAVPDAVSPETLEAISADVASHRHGFNLNRVTGVYYDQQYYMCQLLAISRTFTEMVTSPELMEIVEATVGPLSRLKALRYYETFGGHHMQWHTDNKTDRGFAQIPGIIFIVYMADVEDGEFQYVRGSQKWSGEKAYNDYSDDFIAEQFASDILSFKGKAGTLLMYDTYGIHRARPVDDAAFVRKSLFWQVDKETNRGEPLLVNPEFLPELTDKLKTYLGFGLPSGYEIFPKTGATSIPPQALPIAEIMQMASTMLYTEQMPQHEFLRQMPRLKVGALTRDYMQRGIDDIWGSIPNGAKRIIRRLLGR